MSAITIRVSDFDLLTADLGALGAIELSLSHPDPVSAGEGAETATFRGSSQMRHIYKTGGAHP